MQDDKTAGDAKSPIDPQAAARQRTAVYQPLDLAIKNPHLAGKRASLVDQTAAARRTYSEELKRDLDEIMQEIMKEDSLKNALSLLATKYAIERNILSEERSVLSEERSLLAEKRTRGSAERTQLAEKRSGLSRIRTLLAKNRSFLAEKRTLMSQQRTFLAKARTELAFIRTGVAFVVLGTGLTRYFGFGWWTVMDGGIFLLGMVMIGTGIYYYLPTRKKEIGLLEVLRQKEEDLMQRKPRIMVLDDDPAVCDMLKVYFRKAGYVVEAFVNPYVAKQRLEATQFDVVITDLMMEGMTGLQILRLIKRVSPTTQVIMITYMKMSPNFIKKVRQDLFDYFTKPVDVKKLQASVKRALDERMLV